MSAAQLKPQPKIPYSEKLVEECIRDHPQVFLGEDLELWEQQPRFGKLRPDLVFIDGTGTYVIVEVQLGRLDKVHLYKSLEYRDALMTELGVEKKPRVILFCEKAKGARQRACRIHGIELYEVSKRRFLKKLSKVDEVLLRGLLKDHSEGDGKKSDPRGNVHLSPGEVQIDEDTIELIVGEWSVSWKGMALYDPLMWVMEDRFLPSSDLRLSSRGRLRLRTPVANDRTFTLMARNPRGIKCPDGRWRGFPASYEKYSEGRVKGGQKFLERKYIDPENPNRVYHRKLQRDLEVLSKLRFYWHDRKTGNVLYMKLWDGFTLTWGVDATLRQQYDTWCNSIQAELAPATVRRSPEHEERALVLRQLMEASEERHLHALTITLHGVGPMFTNYTKGGRLHEEVGRAWRGQARYAFDRR